MDTEDIDELLQVFDRKNPTLDDLLDAESQRKKKNRLRKITSQHDRIRKITKHEEKEEMQIKHDRINRIEIKDLELFGKIPEN